MDSNITPATTTALLSLALVGDIYALYKVYETREISLFVNDVRVGPYTPDGDPVIFWSVIALQIIVGLAIAVYLWFDWNPRNTEDVPYSSADQTGPGT